MHQLLCWREALLDWGGAQVKLHLSKMQNVAVFGLRRDS